MDILTLGEYYYQRGGNSQVVKASRQFIEFYINDKPLSELLNSFYKFKEKSILDNSVGVLGSFSNVALEIVKLNQLIGKEFTEADLKQVRESFPIGLDANSIEHCLDGIREEIANPEILIYCCAECGDYLCGGVTVNVKIDDDYVTWIFTNESQKLTFQFNKYSYYNTLKKHMQKIRERM